MREARAGVSLFEGNRVWWLRETKRIPAILMSPKNKHTHVCTGRILGTWSSRTPGFVTCRPRAAAASSRRKVTWQRNLTEQLQAKAVSDRHGLPKSEGFCITPWEYVFPLGIDF